MSAAAAPPGGGGGVKGGGKGGGREDVGGGVARPPSSKLLVHVPYDPPDEMDRAWAGFFAKVCGVRHDWHFTYSIRCKMQ